LKVNEKSDDKELKVGNCEEFGMQLSKNMIKLNHEDMSVFIKHGMASMVSFKFTLKECAL
jgi:hypothetical protein